MNALVLLVGIAAGAALWLARLTAEGDRPAGEERGYIHYFIVAATAANIYAAYAIASGPSIGLFAAVALALLAASEAVVVHIAVRPSVRIVETNSVEIYMPGDRDLDLALAACAPYVYLFAFFAASLALGWPSIWPPY